MTQFVACLTVLLIAFSSYTCTCSMTVTTSVCTLATRSHEHTMPELHGMPSLFGVSADKYSGSMIVKILTRCVFCKMSMTHLYTASV
eukprot:10109-Heterococcus_DN1.PRE.3